MEEYHLRVLQNLPFSLGSFDLATKDLQYDYEALRNALIPIGCWQHVQNMSADALLYLRGTIGYLRFRSTFHRIASECNTSRQVLLRYTEAVAAGKELENSPIPQLRRSEQGVIVFPFGQEWTSREIDHISDRMRTCSDLLDAQSEMRANGVSKFAIRKEKHLTGNRPRVAIFVALPMEEELLIKRLRLESAYPELFHFGTLSDADVMVFSSNQMGRVPAAISAMNFLSKSGRPDFLIVAGIAGGIKDSGVHEGDLLFARSIADLAIRRIQLDDAGISAPEFRPKEFTTDVRIHRFLSHVLKVESWQAQVTSDENWPAHRRPQVHVGTICSADEVVSSNDWTKRLLTAWPKLLGVEMEAGGVCAVAAELGMNVTVIRGVSDLADPAKADNEWRSLAMRSIIHLLERVKFADVLKQAV